MEQYDSLDEDVRKLVQRHIAGPRTLSRLRLVLSTIKKHVNDLNIDFDYCDRAGRNEQTLSSFTDDDDTFETIQSTTIGASNLRYFMGMEVTPSQDIVVDKQNEYGRLHYDKDLQMILPKLKQDLESYKIEPNKTCFYNNLLKIHAIPDGTAIIDGVVCPVEVLWTKESRKLFQEMLTEEERERSRSEKNRKEQQKRLVEKQKREKSLAKLAKIRDKNKRDEEPYTLNKRPNPKRSKQDNPKEWLSNISKMSDEQKSIASFENRSHSQSKRRIIENLNVIHDPELTAFIAQKKPQINGQMICMNAHKCLCVYWQELQIHYQIFEFDVTWYQKLCNSVEYGSLSKYFAS